MSTTEIIDAVNNLTASQTNSLNNYTEQPVAYKGSIDSALATLGAAIDALSDADYETVRNGLDDNHSTGRRPCPPCP